MITIAVIGILYVVGIILCFTAPLYIRILLFGVNLLAPDFIPLLDEILMGAGVLSKFVSIMKILEFTWKVLKIVLPIAILFGILYFIAS